MTQLPRHTAPRDPLDAGGKPQGHATPFSRPPPPPAPGCLAGHSCSPAPCFRGELPSCAGLLLPRTVGGFCMSRRVQLVTETQSGSHLLVTGRTSLSWAKASRWTLSSQDVATLPPNHCREDWTGAQWQALSPVPCLGLLQ